MCIQFVCGNLFKKAVEGYRKLNSLELASWFSLLYHLYVNSSRAVMCNSVDVINVLFGGEAGFVCIHANTTVFDSCLVFCDCNGIHVLPFINLIIKHMSCI